MFITYSSSCSYFLFFAYILSFFLFYFFIYYFGLTNQLIPCWCEMNINDYIKKWMKRLRSWTSQWNRRLLCFSFHCFLFLLFFFHFPSFLFLFDLFPSLDGLFVQTTATVFTKRIQVCAFSIFSWQVFEFVITILQQHPAGPKGHWRPSIHE